MIVSDIIDDVKEILGQCDQARVFRKITDVIEILSTKGEWDPNIGYIDICAPCGYEVTLHRDIDTPLAVNVGGQPTIFRNKWFEFHINGPGSVGPTVSWTWDDRGFVPTNQDIIEPSKIIGIADLKNDLLVPIRIYGFYRASDGSDKEIYTQEPDGTWKKGFVIPLNLITDFPSQIPVPDDDRLFIRYFTAGSTNFLTSTTAHELTTGAQVGLSLITAPLPSPLINGADYFVRSTDSDQVSLFATREGALTNTSPITIVSSSSLSEVSLTDTRDISVNTIFLTTTNHSFRDVVPVTFTGSPLPGGLIAGTTYYAKKTDSDNFTLHPTSTDATNDTDQINPTSAGTTVVVKNLTTLAPYTKLSFSTTHNLLQGDSVTIANTGGILPSPLLPSVAYFVKLIDANTITLHPSLADATSGTNPIVLTTSGSGTNVVVKTLSASAVTGSANNISAINHNLAVADLIQFTTTGTFPAPLAAATNYKMGNPSSANTFTVSDLAGVAINLTTSGTGQLFLIISRAFTVAFTDSWRTDTTALTTATPIKLSTTGTLPSTTPASDTTTTYYVRLIADSEIEIYDSAINAGGAPATTGRVVVNALGTGVLSLVLERSVSVQILDSDWNLTSSEYLQDGATVRLETTGTLPAPFAILTDYLIGLVDGDTTKIILKDVATGNTITPSNVGSGTHSFNLTKNFQVDLPNTVSVNNHVYETGDFVQASSTVTLPSPLVISTNYYIRYITDNTIELYDTLAHAIDLAATTGRIVPTNAGTGIHSLTQVLDNFDVSRVTRISKGVSNSFIKLIAWDDGREDSVTLLGYLYPDETEPIYRRIRLASCCAWVRMRYRRKNYQITSLEDFIPLHSKMAILYMLKSIEFYNKGFEDKARNYELIAENFLIEKQTANEGVDSPTIQVMNRTYTESRNYNMT